MNKRFNPHECPAVAPESTFNPVWCLHATTIEGTSLGAILAAFASGKPEDLAECEEDVIELAHRISDCLEVFAAYWRGISNRLDPKTVAESQRFMNELVRLAFDLQAAIALAREHAEQGGRHE